MEEKKDPYRILFDRVEQLIADAEQYADKGEKEIAEAMYEKAQIINSKIPPNRYGILGRGNTIMINRALTRIRGPKAGKRKKFI